eukprot:2727783-Pleurochrysis_carterae.AAC.6
MQGFVRYDESNKAHFNFTTALRFTCEEYTRVAYGVTRYSWNKNMAALRKGPGVLKAAHTMKLWGKAARAALKAEKSSSHAEAISWWMTMFEMWDTVPSEFMIVHPRIV